MAAVTVDANDAAELAGMLQFLADWLNRDPSRLGASLEDFAGHPADNTCQLREDLDRFIFPARRQRRRIPLPHRADEHQGQSVVQHPRRRLLHAK